MWRFYTPTASPNPAPLVTSLPSGAVDGQQVVLVDSVSAPTYAWLLQYVGAKASNKWVFVGGAPASSEVATAESTAATAFTALATAGPSIAIPVAGDYMVSIGFAANNLPAAIAVMYMSYDIGGTGAADADAVYNMPSTTSGIDHVTRTKKKAGLTAVTLTSKYKVSASTCTFVYRWMNVLPIAIGG